MKFRRVLITTVALALTGGCGIDPATIEVPGTRVGGQTYQLHIQFADVLNLPPGAKVFANGVLVGNLDSVRIVDPGAGDRRTGYAVVTLDITDSVKLPASTIAELRQATPLGDMHIALTSRPDDTGPLLASDATIPIHQTKQSRQVEDTLAGLATAMGSGAILDMQNVVRQLNTALPPDAADTARMFGVLGNDLRDVADNLGEVDSFLNGLDVNATTMLVDGPLLNQLLDDYGVEHVTAVVSSIVGVLNIMSALGPVATQAAWLAPAIAGLDGAAHAMVPLLFTNRPLDLHAPSNLSKLTALIREKIIPFTEHGPKIDIVGATVADAAAPDVPREDKVQDILATLRMIGVVR
ncbi:MlaD family protein [Nocardia abscessus]|uniref:MlaD family protein n=1 Tax=Nocardia abscessus TaxID=120957 RepID=UPI00245471E4|nr:MlaD family protein [Nocardia abscessus]